MQLIPQAVANWFGVRARPANPPPRNPGPQRDTEGHIPAGATPPTGVYTDIPVMSLGQWGVDRIQTALNAHQLGNFSQSAMLAEAMIGDDRVQSAMNGRVKGVTMRHVHTRPARRDKQRRVRRAVERAWKRIFNDELQEQLMMWSVFLGFALCEVQWQAVEDEELGILWVPFLKIWHPSFVWYDVAARQYVAITQEGNVYIDENDPHWFLYTPYGEYRGWLRGAVRSCAAPWLISQYSRRDWARYCEVHGLPIRLIDAPAQSNAPDKARMFSQVRNVGAQTTILLPQQGGQDAAKWDIRLLEAKDESWAAFPGLIKECHMAIQLSIRGTNLTSEVQGGSYAAAQVHSDEDSSYADSDSRKLCASATKLFRLFCAYNFGDANLCPSLTLEAPDKQDKFALAQSQYQVAQAFSLLIDKGVPIESVDVRAWFEHFDIPLIGDEGDPFELEDVESDEDEGYDVEEAATDVRSNLVQLLRFGGAEERLAA
jgi:phage gp29-like protein